MARSVLAVVTLLLVAPLIWAMSGHGPSPSSMAATGGVSHAIWLSLGLMALYVGLCWLIMNVDRPEQKP